ncbi:DUF6114 domain-containing protein [Kitasatospora sp. NPDC052896]|uniref:DUF6114 domain-containing protein n=1 Tax=Kitasatospora sp. NPDC052896 TaxID=3364061 RepID=UPI0037C86145
MTDEPEPDGPEAEGSDPGSRAEAGPAVPEAAAPEPAVPEVEAPEVEVPEVEVPVPASAVAAPVVPVARVRSFAAWRGRRPFWGGLLVTLAGAEILVTEKAPLPVILHIGMQGLAGYLVPILLLVTGLLLLFNPAQRLFYSILAVLLTLGTWITSNLGGFLLGMLLGLIGSSLAFGWLPEQPARRRLLRRGRGGSATPA